jgi:hypothetical protein
MTGRVKTYAGPGFAADSAADLPYTCDVAADRGPRRLPPPRVIDDNGHLIEMVIAVGDDVMDYHLADGTVESRYVPFEVLADQDYLDAFEGLSLYVGSDHPRDALGNLRKVDVEADSGAIVGVITTSWADPVTRLQMGRVKVNSDADMERIRRHPTASPMYCHDSPPEVGTAPNGRRYTHKTIKRWSPNHVLSTDRSRHPDAIIGADAQEGRTIMDELKKLVAMLAELGIDVEMPDDMEAGDAVSAISKAVGDAMGALKEEAGADVEKAEGDARKARAVIADLNSKVKALAADSSAKFRTEWNAVQAAADSVGCKLADDGLSIADAKAAVIAHCTDGKAGGDLAGDALDLAFSAVVKVASTAAAAAVNPNRPSVISARTRQAQPQGAPAADATDDATDAFLTI